MKTRMDNILGWIAFFSPKFDRKSFALYKLLGNAGIVIRTHLKVQRVLLFTKMDPLTLVGWELYVLVILIFLGKFILMDQKYLLLKFWGMGD